ncbi:small ribosomal subunit protein mS39-like [Saccoglossus kowalevskii]|uniref:Small ribosomal subunit protein mS39 n=1 Tax=Saccoglossus kowalevskii TaxID=10224 RepID=A0ABM0GRC1_SACKO|nr:PREDICTED: pentatricopeptide repeat domain-containing protein 3, mitochondrial-like [Saccoglossus kowalevskii]
MATLMRMPLGTATFRRLTSGLTRLRRHVSSTSSLSNEMSQSALVSEEEVIIPRRKKKDHLAVLRALASTVGKDPTSKPYVFHDDPYLLPRTAGQQQMYSLSAEAGKKAARYVLSKYPENFQAITHDEPKIECLYPKIDGYVIENACEEGILERVNNRDVKAAMEMHCNMMEQGMEVNLETNNLLLDLLCFYGGKEAPKEFEDTAQVITEEVDDDNVVEPEIKPQRRRGGRMSKFVKEVMWEDGNYADKLFSVMQQRDSNSYCSMVRGMVKHRAQAKAFELYNEMQDKGIKVDIDTYHALIQGSVAIRESYWDRWQIVLQLLKQMKVEGIKPTLATFNSVLIAQGKMGAIGRTMSLQTLSEMKALDIEPNLAIYSQLLSIFYKPNLPLTDMLYDIMDEIEDKCFVIHYPNDTRFFLDAMSVCQTLRDVQLAHKVNRLVNIGENYKLLGNNSMRYTYYTKLFNLVCQLDTPDNILDFYQTHVPSYVVPNIGGMQNLLQAVETYDMIDKLADIWEDIKNFELMNRQQVIDQVLYLMAKDTHKQEHQQAFSDITMEISKIIADSSKRRDRLVWSTTSIGYAVHVNLKAKQLDRAWETMRLYPIHQRVPSSTVADEFLAACIEMKDTQKVLGLVEIIADSGMVTIATYVEKIKQNLRLSEDEEKKLDDIVKDEL